MIAAIGATLLLVIAGWPFARERTIAGRIGESYLLGAAVAAAVLLADSFAGVPWSRITVIVPLLVVAVVAAVVGRKSLMPGHASLGAANLIDLVTVALAAGYARYATMGPSPENAFVEIWGLTAKEFAFAHAIDWQFLAQPFNRFSHVDYPILVPLLFDFHDLVAGNWPGRWLGVVNAGFGIATLLLLRGFLASESSSRPWRAQATQALFGSAVSPWLGLAECAMVAYGTAGLLFVRRGLRSGIDADIMRGAIYLGLAANSKNEGLALIVAAACALMVAGASRKIIRLWPAIVLILPWQIARLLHHLHTDLMASGMAARAWERMANLGPMLRAIIHDSLGQPLLWIGIAIALIIGVKGLTRDRFLAAAIGVQFVFFLAAYFVTPHDVTWHIRWSWERLVAQLTPSLVFLAAALINPYGDGGKLSSGSP